ncbi:hypothetical protein M441DRAFT_386312 [Trichoderma asperellum CBS 433.97]|uniref:Uncharacterized protein n=1 Tax=Trichoderma asperellum (strain ATCC 204424 / CBS 433.97 / NBRC 101777) TaxID=1042311 RepID=A0A2T3ZBN5_TRIA4|nr:hypothetical protein M441DRAFT_386312 [Trichoderma asperellum CBS 433.97]PTB42223.1 hypothetical protein M441DRAFT_386312 [Trichoderma asperellum CBS 433.97]
MSSTLSSIILKKKLERGNQGNHRASWWARGSSADLGGSGDAQRAAVFLLLLGLCCCRKNKQDAAWKTRKARSRVFSGMWQNRARPHEAFRRRLVPWRFLAMGASRCATALYLPLCTRRQIASQGRDLFGEGEQQPSCGCTAALKALFSRRKPWR